MGKPKYLPKVGVDRNPSNSLISILPSEDMFGEKNTYDFSMLTFWPEREQMVSNTS